MYFTYILPETPRSLNDRCNTGLYMYRSVIFCNKSVKYPKQSMVDEIRSLIEREEKQEITSYKDKETRFQ